jgi:oxygen-independent coproporphyrinogen-3 oxidase
MDHFAKPNDELAIALREKKLYRNFQGYSTNAGCDLYAFGITSISQLKNVYAQNVKTEKEYFQSLDNERLPVLRGYKLNEDDQIRRTVIMKLMCDFELNFVEIENQYGINFKDYFKNSLNSLGEMVDDGLLVLSDDRIKVTEMGRLLIRNIAMKFDGFIERQQDQMKYSRTI